MARWGLMRKKFIDLKEGPRRARMAKRSIRLVGKERRVGVSYENCGSKAECEVVTLSLSSMQGRNKWV
jgi:hypothetical protein